MRSTLPQSAESIRLPRGLAVLCVAHPGHELRVHGWLRLSRPLVFVLTDGSGASGRSRVEFTRRILQGAGARPGVVFGRWTDAEAYAHVIEGRAEPFIEVVAELAAVLRAAGGGYVVGDAAEGYNAIHDVCRLIIDAAVASVRDAGIDMGNYDFPLVGSPTACPPGRRTGAIEVQLGRRELELKLDAARACGDLSTDVEAALRVAGAQAFAVELLRPVAPGAMGDGLPDTPPHYERVGEERVAAGKYRRVLRRREHLLPLADALRRAGSERRE